jgi:hypothetical protein
MKKEIKKISIIKNAAQVTYGEGRGQLEGSWHLRPFGKL